VYRNNKSVETRMFTEFWCKKRETSETEVGILTSQTLTFYYM